MTTDLKAAQEMMAAAVAARAAEDPEIVSVKRVVKLLDKTAKSNRTYGSTNPVAQKFTQQLFEELTNSPRCLFKTGIPRSTIRIAVQGPCRVPGREGWRKREHRLQAVCRRHPRTSPARGPHARGSVALPRLLMERRDSNEDDDDIVTRLWSRNLSTITLVTAEELSKSSVGNDGLLRLDGSMSSSDSTLRELLDREREAEAWRSGNRLRGRRFRKRQEPFPVRTRGL